MFGYDELRAEQKRRRDAGDPVQLGIGVSTFTEMCGLAPVAGCSARSTTAPAAGSTRACGCWPPARSRSSPARRAHGQGHETAFSQIVADRLGVPFEDVEVLHGDTQVAAQGPGHLRLALAGRRRRGAGPGGRQGDREGQADRGAPARGHRRRHRVHRPAGSRVKGTDQGMAHRRRSRWRRFAAHNLPDGIEPTHRRRGDVRPGQLLLPARHPPVRDGGRHRDRRR